ncbi:hypothetical protein H5U35_10220, partial [Candidatus Aerophobetes bacterium]|nr:hypothetical protein [Candidatus Aerophobetes bacterium]
MGAIVLIFGALFWLVIRSGTRIDRLRYPCQRASLHIVLAGIPLIGSLMGAGKLLSSLKREKAGFLLKAGVVMFGLIFFYFYLSNFILSFLRPETIYVGKGKSLKLTPLYSASPLSTVYIAHGEDAAHSLNLLLSLMQEKGLSLYRTSSSSGIISKDD